MADDEGGGGGLEGIGRRERGERHERASHADDVAEYSKTAVARGLLVIIAGAGGAAHLAGVVAAVTPLPRLRAD